MGNSSYKSKRNQFDIYKLFHILSHLNYIFYTFIGTILFWFVNIPLLIVIFSMDMKVTTLPFFVLASLSVGPGFTALLRSIKDAKEKDKIIKPFFDAYRMNFKSSIIVWAIVIVFIGVSGTNLLFLESIGQLGIFKWLNMFILTLLITFILNYLLVIANFEAIPLTNAVVVTLKLSLVKSVRYALSLMIVIGSYVLLSSVPIYLALFGIGIIALLLLGNFQPIVECIQENQQT